MSKIERRSLDSRVYDTVRNRIITGKIPGGARIDIRLTAEEFGVSPIPVREALKRLSERGLVIETPGAGYHAVNLSKEDVWDIFAIRKVLEPFALRMSIENLNKQMLKELRERTCALLHVGLPREVLREEFRKVDRELHQECIINEAKNKYLQTIYATISDHVMTASHLHDEIEEGICQHLEIIDALVVKHLSAAQNALATHLESAERVCAAVVACEVSASAKVESRSNSKPCIS